MLFNVLHWSMKASKTTKSPAASRQHLLEIRDALLNLHKALIDSERGRYEKTVGPIQSPNQFLQLLITDPWFAWLRQLSELIVEMDELLAAKETPSEATAQALIQQATILLTPSEAGSEFQKKYFAAMQESPEVVLAHSEFAGVLGPARLSKEIH